MPRKTAAEVIAIGEYLQPDFDPSTLTAAQLLNIFNYHDIKYPTQYTKPKLVQLFNAEIKSKADQLKQGRSRKDHGQPSGTGNKEDFTSRSISKGKEFKRSSSASLPPSLPLFPQDSGWEYNNVFQSGATTSFRARPSPEHARPSVALRTSLKSHESKVSDALSLPPAPPSSRTSASSPIKLRKSTSASQHTHKRSQDAEAHEREIVDEEQEVFEADERVVAPSQHLSEGSQVARRNRSSGHGPYLLKRLLLALLIMAVLSILREYKHDSAEIGFCDAGKSTNAILDSYMALSAAIDSCNKENRTTLNPIDPTVSTFSSEVSAEGIQSQREVTDDVGGEACPPLPLIPLPHPLTCSPCPQHAVCTPSTMTCEKGFILHPHPLLYFVPIPSAPTLSTPFPTTPTTFTRRRSLSFLSMNIPELVYFAISLVLDGVPGVGPVAFPPRCVTDPHRSLHIGVLVTRVRGMLAAEHGRRLCEAMGVETDDDEDTDAKRWGVELQQLKDKLKDQLKDKPKLLLALEDTFNEVIQQLIQQDGVFMDEDARGKRYLAHRTPSIDWHCAVKFKVRDAWNEWRRAIFGGALFVVTVLVVRRCHAQNVAEKQHVAALVGIVLDLLRDQEAAHHIDPVTAPLPYLSSLQLCDLVLQDEHSVHVCRRLWSRVEHVVEGNANIRTSLEEVEGGDELRVWCWVGRSRTISSIFGSLRDIASDNST